MRITPVRLDDPQLVRSVQMNVLSRLRPEDLYEFSAAGRTPQQIADVLEKLAIAGDAWVLLEEDDRYGIPVFCWGVFPVIPGVWQLWGFGTKQTRRAMPQITRWGMQTWLPNFIKQHNPRRIEVRVPVSSAHSIGWLRKLGMEIEARLPNYSIHGEDFFQLAITFDKRSFEYVSPAMGTHEPIDNAVAASNGYGTGSSAH